MKVLSAQTWVMWALLSAVFAAFTAIFAKVGLEGIDSDYATLVRTAVIIVVLGLFVAVTGKWRNPVTLPSRSVLFLVLSGLATGRHGYAIGLTQKAKNADN
jgi:transporter family protein